MNTIRQQIIISGVGGQGILFAAGILAETAIQKGFHVLTSETHGMAQRGGSVVAHLKIGDYTSPLIRPRQADVLIAFREESFSQYESFLKPDGWAVVNSKKTPSDLKHPSVYCLDADTIAKKTGNVKAVNMILLGFAAAVSETVRNSECLFCTIDDIQTAIETQTTDKIRNTSLAAIKKGYSVSF